MPRDYVTLERDAQRGKLSYRTVTLYRNKGWITDDEARELNRLITEYQRQQAGAAPPTAAPAAPVPSATFPTYTFEEFAEEVRSNRISAGDEVDFAWRWAVGLREACGRRPRDKARLTEGLDPFALRVLRYIYNRRFDDLGVAEGVRILGLCSYKDLRRLADQGAHEKRLRTLNGNFDYGVLKDGDVADASKKGLGIPVTVLGGQVLTGLLVQHYNRKTFLVSSFGELESALTSPAGQGGLDLTEVQKAKEGGRLLQVLSPEVLEQSSEEQRLQELLGPEYWYLNSATGPEGEEFAILVDRHRMVREDGSRDPRPILQIIADRLSGDGVTITEDDLWSYFGGRPDPDAPLPQRPQSVFFSEKLAEHFAGRLNLPVEVVRQYFTAHHDLAEEILSRQSGLRKAARGAALLDIAVGPAVVPLGSIIGVVAGAFVGLLPAIILRSGILLPIGVIAGGGIGSAAARLISKMSLRGRRVGILGTLVLGSLISCGAYALAQTIAHLHSLKQAVEMRQGASDGPPGAQGTRGAQSPSRTPMVGPTARRCHHNASNSCYLVAAQAVVGPQRP